MHFSLAGNFLITLAAMAITILAPAPAVPYRIPNASNDEDPENGGVDLEGDSDMRPAKRARYGSAKDLVTPGETVTDDPQWMRYTALSNLIFAKAS